MASKQTLQSTGGQRPKAWSPQWRARKIEELQSQKFEWDLVIVGGGICGAGIYREAAGRGLKVLLVEQQDFAWGTSSRSSKMVHGGLRYLASGQLGLARDSVRERQNLLNELPGLVDPLPFLMGHYQNTFPGPWLFDKVLTIYDWMAGKRFRGFIKTGQADRWAPGMDTHELKGVSRFADAVTDDARLVLRVLHDGNEAGGVALNYLKALTTLRRNGQVHGLELEDQESGQTFSVNAKAVINATGAWTDVLRQTLGHGRVIRPLRGSHLVVPYWRLPVAFSVSFFHPEDKRPVFVFPWEGMTVIGTTDLDHDDEMSAEAAIHQDEVDYLLAAANSQFTQAGLSETDIVSTWSGVRPVVGQDQNAEVDPAHKSKPSDEKREHSIWNEQGLVSVAGGKLTTYRLIALEVLRELITLMPEKLNSAALADPLPFVDTERRARPRRRLAGWQRMIGRYGRHASDVYTCTFGDTGLDLSLGRKIGSTDTLWSELLWTCASEAVVHLDDLLLRRTRVGLLLPEGADEIREGVMHICMSVLGWSEQQWDLEWTRYQTIVRRYYSLPRSLSDSP